MESQDLKLSKMDAEDIKHSKEIIQEFLKAKKNLRIYPPNNPIYAKTVENAFHKMSEFYETHDELKLRIKQNELLLENKIIYQNPAKEENLALFFFKDGLREITFHKGLSGEELRVFLEILAFDFEKDDIEDDIVTLLWEKDFQNIKYVVDDTVLTEDEDYEAEAVKQAKDAAPEEDDLQRAYDDAFKAEDSAEPAIVTITDKDVMALVQELERDGYDKKRKLMGIIFEILLQARSATEYKDIVAMLNSAVDFSVKEGDLKVAIAILAKTRQIAGAKVPDELRRHLPAVFSFAGSLDLLKLIGEMLDEEKVDEKDFDQYVRFMNRAAINPMIIVLGELKNINARKSIINALTLLGKKDISALVKGLQDSRWYVVRNIIFVLRRIGDKKAVEPLYKAMKNPDIRVKKEVLKALGELGGQGAIPALRDSLNDPEISIRTAAVRALTSVSTDVAKRIIMHRISGKKFIMVDFSEKKEYFEALAHWREQSVQDFFMKHARKWRLFKKAKNDENRACAVYGLGLLGSKDSLALLHKLSGSGNRTLSDYAVAAIKRIEHGG